MSGPGAHEAAAAEALRNGEMREAQVRAILALAAAVNRLADVHYSAMEGPDSRSVGSYASKVEPLYDIEPGSEGEDKNSVVVRRRPPSTG